MAEPLDDLISDVGTGQYRSQPGSRDGLLIFRKQFLLHKYEPPCDCIRALLTDIEFEGEIDDDATTATIAAKLDLIERHVALMRELVAGKTLRDVSASFLVLRRREVNADRGGSGGGGS